VEAISKSNPKPLFRLMLFLGCAALLFATLYTLYAFTATLHQLDLVEAERDQWQRPLQVLQALDLKEGNTAVDLGSGAGYFALKLSPAVGERGQVLAVDLRKLSLFFLWTRALLRGQHNVHVVVGEENDPHLPDGPVDALLICNTYHELGNPKQMLGYAYRVLRTGGRLVVVDRAPHRETEYGHGVLLSVVDAQLRQAGFTIVREDHRFIERPDDDTWWLLVAQRP